MTYRSPLMHNSLLKAVESLERSYGHSFATHKEPACALCGCDPDEFNGCDNIDCGLASYIQGPEDWR